MDLSNLTIEAAQKRSWSPLQEAIFSALASPDNLIIEAVAGSGKTTTILEAMNRSGGKCLFLAFNKAIADDLRSRVSGAEVRTLNALGHSIVSRRLPGVRLETWKTSNAVKSKLRTDEYVLFGSQVSRLVSLAKGSAFGILRPADRAAFLDLIDQFEIDVPAECISRAAQVAEMVFKSVIDDFTAFDFDDQLYLPVFHDWTFPTFDTVFIDEAQDLNAIQHLMLHRLAAKGARIIAVGDTRQAIYGFRGASHSSMAQLKSNFNMTELPLSITYRCDRAIVELAQTIVPYISARSGAGTGEILYWDAIAPASLPANALVVCRNNAPIFRLAMRALIERVPVRVLSNFTASLSSFIKAFKTQDLIILRDRLDKWHETEAKQAEESGFLGRLAFLEDKRECVLSLMEGASNTGDMLNALERFSNSTIGPTLCTIHKAKGLEAETTIILNREKIPSRFATTEASLTQENNLLYVAITRAKHSLIIHSEPV